MLIVSERLLPDGLLVALVLVLLRKSTAFPVMQEVRAVVLVGDLLQTYLLVLCEVWAHIAWGGTVKAVFKAEVLAEGDHVVVSLGRLAIHLFLRSQHVLLEECDHLRSAVRLFLLLLIGVGRAVRARFVNEVVESVQTWKVL